MTLIDVADFDLAEFVGDITVDCSLTMDRDESS